MDKITPIGDKILIVHKDSDIIMKNIRHISYNNWMKNKRKLLVICFVQFHDL